MTTIQIASLVFNLVKEDKYEEKDVLKLKALLHDVNTIESRIYENAILPRFLEAISSSTQLSKDENRATAILELITLFTEKTYLTNEVAFKTVVIVLLNKIYDPIKNVMHNVGETVLIATLNCIETLSRRLESETVERFYKKENATIVGQIIHIALENLLKDTEMALRFSAVNCLMSILQVHDNFDTNDIVLRAQIADVVFVMTPRIFVILSKIIESDARTPQKLRARVLEAFGRILCLIFEDQNEDVVMDEITQDDFLNLVSPKTKIKAITNEEHNSLKRTMEWKNTAMKKLSPFFDRLPSLLFSDYGPLVHKQLVEICYSVTSKCSRNFQEHNLVFFEILLTQANNSDDWDNLGTRLSLQKNSNELMIKGLTKHLRQFPRIIHRKSEQQLLLALKLLNGYVVYFQQTNLFILTNDEVVDQIFDNLLLLFELESPPVCLEEVLEWNEMNLNMNKSRLPWRKHKYLREEHLEQVANQLINTLLSETLMPVFVNKIFDKIVTNSNISNELICLILRMLNTTTDKQFLVEQTLTEFLNNQHWYLETRSDAEIAIEELHFNVIHLCLVIELTGTCSSHLPLNSEQYLFDVMPKMLEKASSTNVLIHSAALYGLELISQGMQVKNVQMLIRNNVDFISHYIEINLRRDLIKASLDMANALLELYTDYDNFYFIQGLFMKIKEIFQKTSISDESLTAALRITLILLRKLRKAQNNSKFTKHLDEAKLDSKQLFDQWSSIIDVPDEPTYDPKDSEFDFDQMKEEMKSISAEEENQEEDEKDEPETAENIFLRDLIRALIRFTSSSNIYHKLYALDAIGHCLNLLDIKNKEFLPTIHLIWSPLAPRFKENNLLIISRTFDLLLVMARLSKDFIQKRASTDVLPCILEFLKKCVTENLSNTGSFASTLTQSFKLQQKIFTDIGEIFQYLDVHEKMLDDLLNLCLQFLNSDQSKMVKESCWNLLRNLFLYDATGVVVKLYSVEY